MLDVNKHILDTIHMHYTSLQLKNYRSYTDMSIELDPGVNIIVGPNASGKTNLLEALLVASKGSSFRAGDRALIKHGKSATKITVITNESQERSVTIKLADEEKTTKEIKINKVLQKRLTVNKIVPTTLFEPEHLRMISGSPETRREYLDGILSITEPDYKRNLNRYKKALAQRNRLLKNEGHLSPDDVFVWDVQLSEYGAKVNEARHQLAAIINKQANSVYSSVSGEKTKLDVYYNKDGVDKDYASHLLKQHQARFIVDRQRGFTTRGPHREDLSFFIGGKDASSSASRGETRTVVLVCKIIELKLLEKAFDKKPIILLDDVFSELDGSRRLALTEYLKEHQTIITTTDADAIVKSFLDGYNVIPTG